MNSDLVEFYYLTKHASSISGREKEASVKEQDEKIAADLRQIASSFAKNHPKAVENAITGGILGGGSELVLPANKDMMGNPSTNLGEIGKRALLGATLGGIGGEVKTQVRNHVLPKIAQENTEKIAGKLDKLKQFASNNAGSLIGAGTLGGLGAVSGYNQEVPDTNGNFIQNSPKNRILNAATDGLFGAATGGLMGHAHDKVRTLKAPSGIKDEMYWPKVHKPMAKNAGVMDLLKKIPTSVRNGAAVKGIATAGQQLAPSSLLQTAGKYMAKSPTIGGAVIGAGAGLTGNFLSGEDHAVGSALAGAGLGALGGKKLLVGNASKSPLFGQSFGTGVRNELKAGLKAKPVISSPITSPSLQNAPKLDSLLAQSGASNIGPSIKPNKPVGPAIAPQRPQEIDWAKKQAPIR